MTTLFTLCDYEKCKRAHEIIYQIANELKTLHKFEEAELKYQRTLSKRLYVLSERYRILDKGAPGVSLYPDHIVERVVCDIMHDIHKQIRNIHESNQKLKDHLNYTMPLYLKLDEAVKEIDWTANGAMIRGDEIFKPLFVYVETVSDWRQYFKRRCVERQVLEDMVDIHHPGTIDAYLSMLNLPEEKDAFDREMSFAELLYKKH